jgi:hypothetical protein
MARQAAQAIEAACADDQKSPGIWNPSRTRESGTHHVPARSTAVERVARLVIALAAKLEGLPTGRSSPAGSANIATTSRLVPPPCQQVWLCSVTTRCTPAPTCLTGQPTQLTGQPTQVLQSTPLISQVRFSANSNSPPRARLSAATYPVVLIPPRISCAWKVLRS